MARSPFAPVPGDDAAPRRSLVLAGGGIRVAYQAGVLAALEEAGLHFHHADGASGGTLNLSMLLAGQDSREMAERWRTLDPWAFSSLLPVSRYLRSWRWPALGGADGLRRRVFPHLGIDAAVVRRAEGIDGTYNVCNFATKSAEVVAHPSVDEDLLVAAVSLPVLMPAVRRGGGVYSDAVWIRDCNVVEAVRRGSDEIWLVWCIGNTATYHDGAFRQYVHMIEMAATGSLLADLAYVEARWPDRSIRLHVIKPAVPIPLDPSYLLGRIDAATLIDLGYQDACRYLDSPTPTVAPWGPAVTRMTDPPPGAAVRLDLAGRFIVDSDGPDDGSRPAPAGGAPLRLHLQLQQRRGDGTVEVAGHVDGPGLAPRTLVRSGTATIGRRGLVLDLVMARPAGRWRLRAGPVPGALGVSASDGTEATVGTGTLRFGAAQLLRALRTVRASDATTTLEAARRRAELVGALLRAWRAAARPGPAPGDRTPAAESPPRPNCEVCAP